MDRDAKKKQIESIEDEVNVLHPLLHDLFNKLSGVTYVEYTHGPNEMGADFVIERTDKAIRDTHYIGVIVKAEKILQNFIELERQVDECGVDRSIRQGKQDVAIQEVWVITSKSISQNAKTKIRQKYPKRKIIFFDSDWIVDLVDEHFPFYWHQLPTATGSYLAMLSRNIAELNAQTTLLQIPNAAEKYIELDIEPIGNEDYRKKRSNKQSKTVNLQDEIRANKITLLEAEMGFGKSRLARRMVSLFAYPEALRTHKIIPVFQPFGVYAETEYDSINDRLKMLVGDACYAEAVASDMTFLLVLDGLDEVVGNLDQRRSTLAKLISDVQKAGHIRLLLTSRPFKLLEEIPGISSVDRYRIRPLSITKLIRYITEVCEAANLPKKLYQDLGKSELFKQLPQNPIAASLLSNLLSQTKQDLPSNLTELYAKSVEYMLGRWDEKRALSTEKLYKACERVAREVARYMVDNKLIYMSTKEAREMVESLLNERNLGVPPGDVFNYLLNRSHVFGMFEDAGTIFFRHRSFAEYLYALDCNQRRNLVIDEKAFHPYWTNVYYFYIGLLGECPDLLRQIIAIAPTEERARWIRCLQIGNYLLAGYQSPYSVIEESLHVLLAELAQLYIDVRNGKTKTKLVELPEIKLLYLFAMVAKHVLGYDFFWKALPLAMAQLDDEKLIEDERKIYALFFAACALGELEDQCGFHFLLEKHKTEALPLPVSLGITGETDARTGRRIAQDGLIKLHGKKLRRLLTPKHDKGRRAQKKLEELYERPLSARKKELTDASEKAAAKR